MYFYKIDFFHQTFSLSRPKLYNFDKFDDKGKITLLKTQNIFFSFQIALKKKKS